MTFKPSDLPGLQLYLNADDPATYSVNENGELTGITNSSAKIVGSPKLEKLHFSQLSPGQRKMAFFLAIRKQQGLIKAIKWAWKNRRNRY